MSHHHGGGSEMGDMGGMDMGTGLFQTTNIYISHVFWYIVVAVVVFGLVANVWQRIDSLIRKRSARNNPSWRIHPSVPVNWFSQTYATTRTMFREMAYPQGFVITKRGFQWLSPPPLGRSLFILGYCIMITVMLTTNSILPMSDAYYYEKIGFRAAWVSLMQVPLIILLAGKVNIIGILIGSSYERLNWLHRWVSRVLLVSVAVHAGFFLRQWIRADFLSELLELLPLVRFGMIAGGLLLWINITGLAPLRHAFYEFWVIQHLASIGVLLWLLYRHVPPYAMFYVWMSIAFIAFDRVCRLLWTAYRNTKIRSKGANLRIADRVGYRTELHALPGQTTRVVIKNVPFNWSAGQHLYIWIPRVGLLETHPFTISNTTSTSNDTLPSNNVLANTGNNNNATLEIRVHSGFSKRLHQIAIKQSKASNKPMEVRSFIQGPYGSHPDWKTFETLVLISASTGASFTLPILESILADPCCVRKCHFILLVRSAPQCSCYLHRLRLAARSHKHPNLVVSIHVAVTGVDDDGKGRIEGELQGRCCCGPESPGAGCMCGSGETLGVETKRISTSTLSSDDNSSDDQPITKSSCCAPVRDEKVSQDCCSGTDAPIKTSAYKSEKLLTSTSPATSISTSPTRDVQFVNRRPMLNHTIRAAVEEARGETCVVVCGGKQLSGSVRNEVARLSDERAVHKGTGAQGIRLWVEEFGF